MSLISNVLRSHSLQYNEQMERYLFPRRTDTQRPSAIPVGYLVNLGIRHGLQTTEPPHAIELWTELITLTTSYCALYDLESYNVFDTIVYSLTGLLELTPRLALYDALYSLVQWRWSDLSTYLDSLFSCVSDVEARGALGVTIDEAISIVHLLGPHMVPPSFDVSAFAPEDLLGGVDGGVGAAAIRQFCAALTAPAPNANFVAPEDQRDAEIMEYPFIKTDVGLVMLPSPLAGPAVFNALCNALQVTTVRDIHDRLGYTFETLVAKLLDDAGVSYLRGFYGVGRDRFECDFIVETAECILFVELKKKILTRRARGGDVIAVLSDLATSLFAAHLQLARHEKRMRDVGALELEDAEGNRIANIDLGGRRIERMALSLQEFGALQDRTVVRDFLTFLPGNTFLAGALTTEQRRALARLEETCSEIAEHEDEIRPDAQGLRFPNASFLSLGNLTAVLDNVACNSDLLRELGRHRFITTGQHDFYSSHAYLRTLPST